MAEILVETCDVAGFVAESAIDAGVIVPLNRKKAGSVQHSGDPGDGASDLVIHIHLPGVPALAAEEELYHKADRAHPATKYLAENQSQGRPSADYVKKGDAEVGYGNIETRPEERLYNAAFGDDFLQHGISLGIADLYGI